MPEYEEATTPDTAILAVPPMGGGVGVGVAVGAAVGTGVGVGLGATNAVVVQVAYMLVAVCWYPAGVPNVVGYSPE